MQGLQNMNQRSKRPAMMGMPKTATNPRNYKFYMPRGRDDTRLGNQLSSLHKRCLLDPTNQSWQMLANNLNTLWKILQKNSDDLIVSEGGDPEVVEVEKAIGNICQTFESYLQLGSANSGPDEYDLLRQDIHREVSFCSKASALSRLLILYAGGPLLNIQQDLIKEKDVDNIKEKDVPKNRMVKMYDHHPMHRPTRKEKKEGTVVEDGTMVRKFRFRPSNYRCMVACGALQHAITRRSDAIAERGGVNAIRPRMDKLAGLMEEAGSMLKEADEFLVGY